MNKEVLLKEKITDTGKEYTAYSTLTGLLYDEGLQHIYRTVQAVMVKKRIFQFGNIIIRKISLKTKANARKK